MKESEIKKTGPSGEAKMLLQASLSDNRKSALQKYRDLVIGQSGFWRFVFFEMVTFFLGLLPGAPGLFLREKIYPLILGSVGENVIFGVIDGGDHKTDPIVIPILAQVQIVKGVSIEQDCWIGAGVLICDGVHLHRGSIPGAGTVVVKDIDPYSVAAGVPAAVIKSRMGAGKSQDE